ncbi:hypothetical protein E2C01_087746 [Portunus trituberculatus]|uniref:Uncharacterized protein n=1 Tax=Portunus trituberculatus TaxID=210409 RepID=A0A5B7JDC2_PORTR|nr:hypothetical protein [Portunus trituberculatus]
MGSTTRANLVLPAWFRRRYEHCVTEARNGLPSTTDDPDDGVREGLVAAKQKPLQTTQRHGRTPVTWM